jgi:hypothetical protein
MNGRVVKTALDTPPPMEALGQPATSGRKVLRGAVMLLFLLVDVNLVVLWGLVTVVDVRTMLPGMIRGKRRSGKQREKQNRRKDSLHGADSSTHAFDVGR